MTQREKVLTTGLLGVLLAVGGGFLFHLFVYEPMSEVRAALDAEETALQDKKNELAKEKKQIDDILEVNPRLLQWSQLSLPPRDPALKKETPEEQKRLHLNDMRVQYETYLSDLMTKAKFQSDTIKVVASSRSTGPAVTKGKEPPYEKLTFTVSGEGRLDNVVNLMREFHRTPLLHHIHGISLGLARNTSGKTPVEGLLNMSLTIEALLVNGADQTVLNVIRRSSNQDFTSLLGKDAVIRHERNGTDDSDDEPVDSRCDQSHRGHPRL